MEAIEKKFEKYNQIKIDLLNVSKCLECCEESQKDLYQNICVEYSKELKKMKKHIEDTYEVSISNCCCVSEKELSSSTEVLK